MGNRFGQDIEPAGMYVNERPGTFRDGEIKNIGSGKVTFENPLVVELVVVMVKLLIGKMFYRKDIMLKAEDYQRN